MDHSAAEPFAGLTILIGLPGSGKSSYASASGQPVVSSDELRKRLTGRYDDLSRDDEVFALAREIVADHLRRGRGVVLDATNVTRARRAPFIALARELGRPVRAVVIAAGPAEAAARNRLREKAVPEQVIFRMARRYEPPLPEEGFAEIVYVRPDGGST